MIKFTCDHCQAQLKVSDDSAGKDARCPTCRGTLKIPEITVVQPLEGTITAPAVSSTSGLSKDGIAAFVSKLATYYMDFLETDFHKRRVPKRSITLRNNKNLRVGLNLAKYDTFQSSVLKVLESGLTQSLSIPRGKYQAPLSPKIKDLITAHTRSISDELLAEVAACIATKVTDLANPRTTDISDALSRSQDSVTETIRSRIVTPFVRDVEDLLHGSTEVDIESVYSMEESLVAILTDPLEDLISECVTSVYDGQPEDIADQIPQILDGVFVRGSIESYFSSCSVSDLFFEIKELVDNNLILDKQDLYLYFCDIRFLKDKYPLFYVPLTITKAAGSFQAVCEPTVYINKKAIEYVVQEFNKEREQQGTIKSIAERIIYPQEHRAPLPEVLGNVLSDIVDYFCLSPEIDLVGALRQEAQGLSVAVSNSMYICIFDKSDEALVNDYEEILELMKSQDDDLIDRFTGLINDFIGSSPKPFKRKVDDEWDKTPTDQKLVFSSPIPLNPEQRQILQALNKEDCKYIAVQGPPGTGKSHTITAIVFQAILRKQSVLVLSDKKEALDVVEEKITDVMNRVRRSDDFQNPILRLGKTGSTYNQILSTTSVNKIRMHFRAARSQEANLETGLREYNDYLTTNIDATVTNYGSVDMADIRTLVSLDGQYDNGENYPIDFTEVLKSEDSIKHVDEARQSMAVLDDTLHDHTDNVSLLDLYQSMCNSQQGADTFSTFLVFAKVVQELRATYQDRSFLRCFRTVTGEDANSLNSFIEKYRELGSGIFGYFLKGKKVEQLSEDMNAALSLNAPVSLREDIDDLKRASAFFGDVSSTTARSKLKCLSGLSR